MRNSTHALATCPGCLSLGLWAVFYDYLEFHRPGQPIPNQFFHFVHRGRSYTDPRVRAWQDQVAWHALIAMQEHDITQLHGPLKVWLEFFRSDARRVDIDNLQKAALDGLQPVLFANDSQILNISAWKRISSKNPRLEITIQEINLKECQE